MSDAQFTRYKSRFATTWAHVNLARIEGVASATSLGTPWAHRTVYVVGAGPSLDNNAEHLRSVDRDARIIATNSSAAALRPHGVTPDVVVVRESIDMSEDIAATEAPTIAIDIAAHPAAWAAAGDRAAWFIPMYPRQLYVARMLGVDAVPGGTAALTSAVRLALMWGASRVILVGCDLAFNGIVYASGAPRGSLRATVRDGGLDLTGNELDDERCERSGQRPPPKRITYEETTAADWSGKLLTINVLREQAEWLTETAQRHPEVVYENATEGGAGVVGWRAVRLADQVTVAEHAREQPRPMPLERGMLPRELVREVLGTLRQQAARSETVAREMLSRSGPDLGVLGRLDGWTHGAPVSEAMAAWKLVDVQQQTTGDSVSRCRQVYEAFREATEDAQEVLMGRAPSGVSQ